MTETTVAATAPPVPDEPVVAHATDATNAGASSAARTGFRPVTAADGPAIEAMVARCSPASRYARFLAPYHSLPPSELERILRPGLRDGAWVAVVPDIDGNGGPIVVGLAEWAQSAKGEAEFAVLVEDEWQRRGIGTALLAIVVARTRAAGWSTMTASVLTGAGHMYRMLAALGPTAGRNEGHVTVLRTSI